MAVYYAEDFESFSAGDLDGQGGWSRVAGSGNPRFDVVGGSLIGGINSVRISDVGGSPSDTYYKRTLATQMTVGAGWHIRFRALAPSGSTGRLGQLQIFLGGDVFSICNYGVYEGSGGASGKTILWLLDGTDSAGVEINTTIIVGARITFDLYIKADGYYDLYANGTLVRSNANFFWNATYIDSVYFNNYDGISIPSVSSVYDSFRLESWNGTIYSPFPSFPREEEVTPAITDVDPEILDIGAPTPVVITGQGFRDVGVSDAVSVIFGSSTVTGTAISSTRIETIAPPKPPRGMASFNVVVNFTDGMQLVSPQVIVYA
jgi:hypothetical protein